MARTATNATPAVTAENIAKETDRTVLKQMSLNLDGLEKQGAALAEQLKSIQAQIKQRDELEDAILARLKELRTAA